MTEEEKEAIERLKHFNDGYTFKDCDVCDNYNEKDNCCNKEKCDELKTIETVLNLIQKQNKVIDEMAGKIAECSGTCPYDIYDWQDIDCEKVCNDNVKHCWREYFIKKVEEK